jgi:glucosamine kinase
MDGSLLGEGESGPANIHSNFRLAMESIRLACEAAFRSAAIGEQSLQHSHAGLGLAGAGIKNACDRLLSQKMPRASGEWEGPGTLRPGLLNVRPLRVD